MRKVLFWIHLAAGLTAGLIVVWMSFTGVLLAYEKQIVAWFDRNASQAQSPQPAAMPRPLTEILAAHARPGTSVTLRSDPREPIELNLGGSRGSIYLDPHTGGVRGNNSSGSGVRQSFQKITAWHRYLGVQGPGRATAKLITGICNLAFLFLVMSGAYLWIPKQWTWQHLRPVLWFRGGLAGKARDFNWHNTLGVWCMIPLAVVVAGAAPISFVWASDFVYRLAGSEPPTPAPQAPASKPPQQVSLAGLEELVARAIRQQSGWSSISFRLPDSDAAPVAFAIDWGAGAQPQYKGTLTLQRDGAGASKWETFDNFTPGRRLRLWLRFLHTGEALGLAGQAVAALASGAAVVLGYSGFALAWRRYRGWSKRSF
jgi:uncharacterized iron-regulated membrane protein